MANKKYNYSEIRQKLEMAFDDSELSAFCLDYFQEIYDDFSQGMRKDDKITLLLDYCRRRRTGFETLLKNVRKEYAEKAEPGNTSNFKNQHLKPLIEALEATKDDVRNGKKIYDSPSTHRQPKVDQTTSPPQFPSWGIAAGGVIVLFVGILLGSMLINGDLGSTTPPEPPPIVSPLTPTATATLPTETPTVATCEPTIPPPTIPPAYPPMISEKDGMTLLYVPEGDFEMGSSDGWDHEKPCHRVFLDAYWIDQTEVTNEMFQRFVAQTNYQTKAEEQGTGSVCAGSCSSVDGADWQHPQGKESNINGLETHPVVLVSFDDATAYCQWAGRRLPSEAEWEKAARGTDRRKYPWGEKAPTGKLANFCDTRCSFDSKDELVDDGYALTAPVGNYPDGASPYGALDMAGNVWEWVNDRYDENYYAKSPRDNPTGPSTGARHVGRGGSWVHEAWWLRASLRANGVPSGRFSDRGFRCAVSDK